MSNRPFLTTALTGVLLAAAGCSTTSVADLQQHAPREVYKTDKPTEVVVRCIVENLGRLGAPNTYTRPDGTTVLHFTLENDTSAIFTFTPGQLEVRTISRIVPFRKKTEACI